MHFGVGLNFQTPVNIFLHKPSKFNNIYHGLNIETAPQKGKSPFPKTLDYRNDTYWILEKRLNWYEALRECKQRGGDLASIHGQSQQLFLEDIVKNDGFPLWLGLSSHDVSLLGIFMTLLVLTIYTVVLGCLYFLLVCFLLSSYHLIAK